MSVAAAAMTGIRAATARQEISTEVLSTLPARPPLTRGETAPPQQPDTTPMPKVHRPARANLYGLARTAAPAPLAYRQITPGYFQAFDPEADSSDNEVPAPIPGDRLEHIRAAVRYRSSQDLLEPSSAPRDTPVDVLI
jgi:hypothetical protein